MSIFTRGAGLSVAVLSLMFTAHAHAQSVAADQAWSRFSAANAGTWQAEWSAAGDQAVSLQGLSAPAAADPVGIAAGFIAANAEVLGLPGAMRDLTLVSRRESTGDTHVTYQQSYGGLPVFNGFIDVNINSRGQVYLVYNNAVSSAAARALSLRPVLGPSAAATFAKAAPNLLTDKRGASLALSTLTVVGQPELGIQRTEGGGSRLAYRVDLGAVAYVVDAATGAVLDTIVYMQSVNGTGQIFDPNPVNTLNNVGLRDQANANYAALAGAYYDDKVLLGILQTGAGAATRYWLRNSYVTTLDLKKTSVGTCMTSQTEVRRAPPGRVNTVFEFNRAQDGFEHTMVFFHIDRSQRAIQARGIANNWNRAIRVDGHAITVDNSFYCGRPVGLGYLAFGDGGVDDAEDADVVLHEYGHALQDNASAGRYLGAGHKGSMGEGFGDYWAYSARASGAFAACFAEWDGQGRCLRRLDKNKKFPANYVGEVHADGEIWSRALRDLYRKLGKIVADKIILKSHFLIPVNPTFSKGLAALVTADQQLNAGANKQHICSIFIDRGISAPACGYWIKMTWNKLGADVDLHMRPPAPLTEVSYLNKHPNWGDQTTDDDDPLLYEDCISSCTSEEITVASLPTPGTYRVFARYYSDHGKGASTVTMEVYRGATRLFSGVRTLATTGQEWFAFNIVIAPPTAVSSEPQIVEVDRVVAGRSGPYVAK